MPSTYSTRLRFELIGTGEQSGSWGNTTNVNLGTLVEEAITGIGAVTVADAGNTDLTAINGGTDQSRNMILNLTGALTGTRTVRCPNVQKMYFVRNGTSGGQSVVFRPLTGNGVTIPNGRVRAVYCDGTDVLDLITDLPLGVRAAGVEIATISDTQTLTNKTLTAPRVGAAILDTNGNESIRIAATASAVNDILVTNAASSGTPTISAVGDDTNVGLNLVSKGSGQVFANSLPVVTTTAAQTVSNKTIDNTNTINARDDIFQLQDNGDSNKRARFELSSVSSGVTRVITIPNFDYTLGQVLNDSVITASIANGQVTEAKIADGNVTVNKLGSNSVTAIKIADLNVTTSKIADLNVTEGKIADGSVTVNKIGNLAVNRFKIADGEVVGSKIADGSVTVSKIGDGQVTESKIADGNVTVNKIGNGQVTEAKLAGGCVTATKIVDGQITEAKIADGNVTVNKIGNGAVTPAKLAQPSTIASAIGLTGVSFGAWTGIPSWAKKITISFVDVTMPSASIFIRLGTGGSYVTTNTYVWDSYIFPNGGWVGASPRSEFRIAWPGATGDLCGHATLTWLGSGNIWVASLLCVVPNIGPYTVTGAGYVDVGGPLERVLVSNSTPTNFSSGAVSLMYE